MLPLSSYCNRETRMKYKDLREFISALEARGELQRITAEVDPYLCLLYTSDAADEEDSVDLGDLEVGVHLGGDALELALGLQGADEFPQVLVLHSDFPVPVRRKGQHSMPPLLDIAGAA